MSQLSSSLIQKIQEKATYAHRCMEASTNEETKGKWRIEFDTFQRAIDIIRQHENQLQPTKSGSGEPAGVQSGEISVIQEDKALLAEILKEYGSLLRMPTICKIRNSVKGY